LEVPPKSARIFELRQYQSASEAAGKKKIEMFNDQGEIDIFKRLGFKPVFWGETIIGPLRPNLTYMVTFDDLAAKDAHWKAFVDDAQWKKISSTRICRCPAGEQDNINHAGANGLLADMTPGK
jgi:hypothetical protein